MTQEEKLSKAVRLADAMYYAAQQLTTDASHLRKATEAWWQFKNVELKESEDEKIRKELIDIVEKSPITFAFEDKGKVLAWLEKQGEKQQKTPIWKHWKDGIAGNGEGKLIYLIKYGHTYSLSSCLCFECDYIELSELGKLLSEKQGEQEPAWSEEDEVNLNRLILYLARKDSLIFEIKTKYINWIKSLKDKIKGE